MGSIDGNLLLVGNYAPGTGYAWWLMQRFWLELAALAAERGLTTYLAYPKPGPVPQAIADSPIEVLWHRVSTRRAGSVWASARLFRQLRIRNIYFTDRAYFDPSYLAFRAAGVRCIINHDHTPGDRPVLKGPRGWLKSLRNRIPGATADRWIALSPLMRDRAVFNGRIPAHAVSVVPNGIVPIEMQPDANRVVKRTFDLGPTAVIAVTVGRAHPYKRIDFVLRVAAHIERTHPDSALTFLYLGDGPSLERLKTMADDLGLSPQRMVFAGHRSDVRDILPGCDIALHPARGEGFSLAILEYMSAGLATLVPDIPSVSQAITHLETGFVFPDEDVAAAADILMQLEASSQLRHRIGRRASSEVMDRYRLDASAARLRSVVSRDLYPESLA